MKEIYSSNTDVQIERYKHCTEKHRNKVAYVVEPRFTETQQILIKFNDTHFSEEISSYSERAVGDGFVPHTERCESYHHTPLLSIRGNHFVINDAACCVGQSLLSMCEVNFQKRVHNLQLLLSDGHRRYCTCADTVRDIGQLIRKLMRTNNNRFSFLRTIRNFELMENARVYRNYTLNAENINGVHVVLTKSQNGDTACAAINIFSVHDSQLADLRLGPLNTQDIQRIQYMACKSFVYHTPQDTQSTLLQTTDAHNAYINNETRTNIAYAYIPARGVDSVQFRIQISSEVETQLTASTLSIYFAGLLSVVSYAAFKMLLSTDMKCGATTRMSNIANAIKQAFSRTYAVQSATDKIDSVRCTDIREHIQDVVCVDDGKTRTDETSKNVRV